MQLLYLQRQDSSHSHCSSPVLFFCFLIPSKTVLEYITFTAKLYSSVKEKTQITEKYISWLFERREYTNMEWESMIKPRKDLIKNGRTEKRFCIFLIGRVIMEEMGTGKKEYLPLSLPTCFHLFVSTNTAAPTCNHFIYKCMYYVCMYLIIHI